MKLGIDCIDNYLSVFEGKRVGLITNPTGINSEYKSTIEVLKEKTNLVALFSPEHGVRGNIQAGEKLDTYIDEASGCVVHSLYGKTKKPTDEMMDSIDVMCIDSQDAGSRFYTFIYTMAYAMMACKEHGKTFVVFDRPNPVNASTYEGNILDLEYRSFVGYYPILQRHGMTICELADLFNREYEIGCDLKLIKMEDYDRTKYYDELDCLWVIPSPNLPTINSAVVYNATCIFEGTNISEGRGTTLPFEVVGAPFIKGEDLARELNNLNLGGVYFRPMYFTPTFSKHEKKMCGGVQLHVLDREKFNTVKVGWSMLHVIRTMYPEDFVVLKPWTEGRPCMLEFETGCGYIKEMKYSLEEQMEILDRETAEFGKTREKYLLY